MIFQVLLPERQMAPHPWGGVWTARRACVGNRAGIGLKAKGQTMAIAKNTICLWYDKDAEAAARFYAETFPDSSVNAVHRAPSDYPSGKAGDVLMVEFTVASWQITPRVLMEAMAAGGDEAKRAFEAMMDMKKIDVAAIEAARRG